MTVRRKKLTIYLERDVARALDADARLRGLPTTRAAADAIRRVLLDGGNDVVANAVKMRLDRVEKREVVRAREIGVIKEALLLFVRVWLTHTDPPDEETLDAMEAIAERRFQSFLDLLSESLQPGRQLFADVALGSQPPTDAAPAGAGA